MAPTKNVRSGCILPVRVPAVSVFELKTRVVVLDLPAMASQGGRP